MDPVRKGTLQRLCAEFPVVPWQERDLDELVAPSFGIITGFAEFLHKVEAFAATDLGDTGLPGALRQRRRK